MKLSKKALRKLILQEVAIINEKNTFGNLPGGSELDSALEYLEAADMALQMYEAETQQYRYEELDDAIGLIHQAIAKIDPSHRLASPEGFPRRASSEFRRALQNQS
jgi:hypothetical protein